MLLLLMIFPLFGISKASIFHLVRKLKQRIGFDGGLVDSAVNVGCPCCHLSTRGGCKLREEQVSGVLLYATYSFCLYIYELD